MLILWVMKERKLTEFPLALENGGNEESFSSWGILGQASKSTSF